MTGSGDTNQTPDAVLARAKAALESEVWCWTGPQTPEIVRGLVATLEHAYALGEWFSAEREREREQWQDVVNEWADAYALQGREFDRLRGELS